MTLYRRVYLTWLLIRGEKLVSGEVVGRVVGPVARRQRSAPPAESSVAMAVGVLLVARGEAEDAGLVGAAALVVGAPERAHDRYWEPAQSLLALRPAGVELATRHRAHASGARRREPWLSYLDGWLGQPGEFICPVDGCLRGVSFLFFWLWSLVMMRWWWALGGWSRRRLSRGCDAEWG